MKKLINNPEDVVTEELQGIAAAHPDLVRVQFGPNLVVRADAPVQGKVGLVSGGGSGHEPMHGGFVGRGMLDAACPGEVFTSPTPDQMLDATKAADGGAGVLHIVKNYTGDVMNFEMSADLARGEGIEVEAVVIDDDVAVQDSLYTAGRRGVGTTVLAEKICGAAAEDGRPLAEVAELCRKVNANGRSMGMALTSCIVPAAGKPTFELGDDEVEIGIGIHGEPGRERVKLEPSAKIVERLATDRRGSALRVGRRGARVRQRHGRHAADRALRRLQRPAEVPRRPRDQDHPQPDRAVHHLARDGRLLDHAAEARRGADAPVGRPRQDRGSQMGRVRRWRTALPRLWSRLA
jgi:phosphoenolpyruvate---glycerone phosphotransferase subunit DhaK